MTKSETILVIQKICDAFPRFIEPSPLEPDIKKAAASKVNLWAEMFADDQLEVVAMAVKRYIATGKFPPTIAEIRAIVAEITTPLPSLSDVRNEIFQLMQSGIAPDDEWVAYKRMSPICKSATMAAGGWHYLSMSDSNRAEYLFTHAAMDVLTAERERRAVPSAYLPDQSGVPALTEGSGHG